MKNVLFDNYGFDKYEEMARESLIEDGVDFSENTVYELASEIEDDDFTNTLDELKSFFEDKTVMFTGAVGRWCGNHTGFDVGDFDDLFSKYTEDCEYFDIYDDNGALYIRCSHHDGLIFSRFSHSLTKGPGLLKTGNIMWVNMQIAAIKIFIKFY